MSFAVDVSNLIKTFKVPGSQHIEVLKGIDLKVKQGEFVCIMGPSGSGKSTLLNILASLESYTDGRVVIAGNEISKTDEKNLLRIRRTTTSIVFQDFNLLPYLSAIENVMLP
ncbi:MAG TPA: ATP-binding cassette domain-containing protein, partial [Candidatus Hodarchaeales archaeon]|nr:ATP-binding cassette domain-containing protein [Candidatus Hodarchaeales archaeon]